MPDHTASEIRRRTKGTMRKRRKSKFPKPGPAARKRAPKKSRTMTGGMMF